MNTKPPTRLPADGTPVDFMGFRLAKAAGWHLGYKTDGGGLKSRLGIGTARKWSGVTSTDADGYERTHDTLRDAVAFVRRWHETNPPEPED